MPHGSKKPGLSIEDLRQTRGVTGELVLKPYIQAQARQKSANGDPEFRTTTNLSLSDPTLGTKNIETSRRDHGTEDRYAETTIR
jgi:hypothetical protein